MFLLGVAQNLANDEMVKQMQEQVISMQDKQISFLNNTITTILAAAAIIVTLVSLVLAGIAAYIGNTSRNAKKTMEEAESVLGSVRTARSELVQDMSDLAVYREETRQEFEELTRLVNSDEIEKLKEATKILELRYKIDGIFSSIESMLDYAKESLVTFNLFLGEEVTSPIANIIHSCMDDFRNMKRDFVEEQRNIDEVEQLFLKSLSLESTCKELIGLVKEVVGRAATQGYKDREKPKGDESST
jgi:hypothetical protein